MRNKPMVINHVTVYSEHEITKEGVKILTKYGPRQQIYTESDIREAFTAGENAFVYHNTVEQLIERLKGETK